MMHLNVVLVSVSDPAFDDAALGMFICLCFKTNFSCITVNAPIVSRKLALIFVL